jgi:hypothetical protein
MPFLWGNFGLDLDQFVAQEAFGLREKVYVLLHPEPDGTWGAAGVSKTPPAGEKFIQGRTVWERKNSPRWEVSLKDDLGNLRTLSPRWWTGVQPGERMTFCLDGRGQVISFFKEDPRRKSPCGRGVAFTGTVVSYSESRFRQLQVEYGIESRKDGGGKSNPAGPGET